MKWKSYIVALVLVVEGVLAVVGHAVPAHTFHTSLMQVEYNQKEQLVEISIQVFSHDLEKALSRRSGKVIKLDRTPEAQRLVLEYLNDAVILKSRDGGIKSLSWIGMEPRADAVWLYVETKMPEGFSEVKVRNRIMFELFDDQINLVHVKHEEKKYDLVFKQGDDFKTLHEARQDKNGS